MKDINFTAKEILPSLLDRRRTKIGRYYYLKVPEHPNANCNGYVAEHRLILEFKLGRMLKKSEHCHHINEITDDNRPGNLEAKHGKTHTSFHKLGTKHRKDSKEEISKTLKKQWKEGKFKDRILPDRKGENNPMYGRKPTQKQIDNGKRLGGWNKGLKMSKISENVKTRKRNARGRFI